MIRHFYFVFIIISIIGLLEAKKYKVKLISSTECNITETKDTTAVTYGTEIKSLNRHTKVIRSNFTVLRAAGPIAMSLKIIHLKGSRKIEIFKIEKVDCHNPITYQLVRMLNMKLTDDCKVMPGNYLSESINPQDFSWILAKAVGENGRYEFQMHYYSEKGLAICNSVICDIQQSKSK